MSKTDRPGLCKLVKVRLSYPYLGKPDITDDGKKCWRAKLITCPDDPHFERNSKAIKKAMMEAAKEKWGDNVPKLREDRKAAIKMDDGDEFDGCIAVSARSYVKVSLVSNRKDRDGKWIRIQSEEEADETFYPGCYVNAVVRFWAQESKKYGKRINCALEVVQFHSDGEPLGRPPTDPDEFLDEDDVPEAGSETESDYEDDDDPF